MEEIDLNFNKSTKSARLHPKKTNQERLEQ